MDFGIKGKRVLVTGASQGVGKAIALAFAKEECRVAIIARREKELQRTVDEMGGRKKGHACHAADLMIAGNERKAWEALVSDCGGHFDIVIHNIGGTLDIKDALAPLEDWMKVVQFNVGIAIALNRLVVPPMKDKKWGRIVHVSSISGESLRGSAPYAVAKAFLNAYVKGLGRALAQDGIVVSGLMPGAVYAPGGHWDENSPHNRADQEAFLRKRADFLRHHHAVARLGSPEEIAPFAVFMASQQASFAQGSLVPVDGGTM
jgi:3-oxoacyl-[acyl-carrier protein] reductase